MDEFTLSFMDRLHCSSISSCGEVRSLSSALAWGSAVFFLPPERGRRREGLGPDTVPFLPNLGLRWWLAEGELANRLRLIGLKREVLSLNMCLKTLPDAKMMHQFRKEGEKWMMMTLCAPGDH